MALKASTMRTLRAWHLYAGLFFAPMLLLFAVSGAFQTFRIPDKADAPGWIKLIAAVHKDQAPPRAKRPKPQPDEAKGVASAPKPDAPKAALHNKLPLQIFVVLLSIALLFSTLSGIVIALNVRAMRRTGIIMLALGTILPIALFYL